MTDYVLLSVAVIGLGICVAHWRIGVLLCIVVGCLQDPIRKIIPGEPPYFTLAILIYVSAACLGAYLAGRRFSLRPIHAWNNSLKSPLTWFMVLVVIQSVVTFIRFGSPILAAIGFLAYVTPVPGILLGYQFARRKQETYKFIKVYLALTVIMVAGVYLSYFGFDWKILSSVGEELFVYNVEKGALLLRSGFFRAPEVAAWHAATSICFLVVMFMTLKRHVLLKLATGVLIIFFWGALLFTGRRKFVMEIIIFLCAYGALLLLVRKKVSKTLRTSFLLAIVVGVAMAGYVTFAPEAIRDEIDPYYNRSATVGADATGRASMMTSESFYYILAQNGPWGSGAGTGSQGAQYFGGGSDIVGGAAEGGLGKIVAELGLPGIVLILWLAIGLARYFWAIIRDVKQTDFERASLIFGFIAMLIANAFVFVTAHQIFGDPFVLILLGFLVGIVMAVPQMVALRSEVPLSKPLVLRPNLAWRSHNVKGEA
jgi:hypothetical protein